jgi:hypothetical protein
VLNKSTITGTPVVNIKVGDVMVPVTLDKKQRIERHYVYVANLNKYLQAFYTQNKDYQVTDPDVKPFLY